MIQLLTMGNVEQSIKCNGKNKSELFRVSSKEVH